MQKKLLLLIVLFSAAFFARAQDNSTPKLGFGVTVGAAVGPNASDYPVASSLVLRYAHPVGEQVSIMATTGFSYFVSKDGYTATYSNYGSYTSGSLAIFLPVQVGVKAYVSERFFLQADVGASLNLNSNYYSYTNNRIAPLVSPAVGYTIPFGASRWSLDLGLGYENRIESGGGYSQINFRAIFNVGL